MKFNKLIKDCVKNINELNSNNKNKHINYKYDTYDNYYKSIKNKLDNFSIPSSVKESINCIIYNNKNNDGLFSAAIVNHYLIDNKGSNISFFGIGQGISNLEKIMYKLKVKNNRRYKKQLAAEFADYAYNKCYSDKKSKTRNR